MNTLIDRYLFRFAVIGTIWIAVQFIFWLAFDTSIQTYLKGL